MSFVIPCDINTSLKESGRSPEHHVKYRSEVELVLITSIDQRKSCMTTKKLTEIADGR